MNAAVERQSTPLRQPDVFERTLWLSSELISANTALLKCATMLEAARMARDLKRMREAVENIRKFHDQVALLNDSMQRAIDNEANRQGVSA